MAKFDQPRKRSSGPLKTCPDCGGGVVEDYMESHKNSQYCKNSYGTPNYTVRSEIASGKRGTDGRLR